MEKTVEATDVTVVTVVEVVVDVMAAIVVVTEVEVEVSSGLRKESTETTWDKEWVNKTVRAMTIVGKRMFLIRRA